MLYIRMLVVMNNEENNRSFKKNWIRHLRYSPKKNMSESRQHSSSERKLAVKQIQILNNAFT